MDQQLNNPVPPTGNSSPPNGASPPNGPPPPDPPLIPDIVAVAEQRLPIAALTDWVTFLQGPPESVFGHDISIDAEWKRLFRLAGLVLLMLGAIIIIFSLGLSEPGQKWQDLATKSEYMLLVLIIGAVIAVPYSFVLAPLVRIRITFVQTFFAVLFLGLPWLPLISLIWALGKVWTNGLIVALFLYILSLVPLYNFCKGVALISGCRPRRAVLSLAIPAAVALAIFVANHV